MVNVCYQLGVECIEVVDYVIPQTDIGRLIGSSYSGFSIMGKGGLTENDNTVWDIVNVSVICPVKDVYKIIIDSKIEKEYIRKAEQEQIPLVVAKRK